MNIEQPGLRLLARTAWIPATILTASTALSIFHQPVGWLPGIAVTALALLPAINAQNALLVIAGLGPLSATVFALLRTSPMGLDFGEAMVLGFLAGYSARQIVHPRRLAVAQPLIWTAAVLLMLALASGFLDFLVIRAEQSDRTFIELVRSFITRDYFLRVNTFRAAMLFAEGVALLVIAADTCGADRVQRDRLLRMMVAGAMAAAVFNVNKILTSAMLQPDVSATFFRYLATARVNINFPDLNAAGSYFALMLFVAAGFVPRARIPATIAAVVIGAGLWIAGSRTALAAVLAGVGLAGFLAAPTRRSRVVLTMVAVTLAAVVVVAAWKLYPQGRNSSANAALGVRIALGKVAVDLTRTHPWFGVGLGHFFELSDPIDYNQNNAHNNFLQISAELGIPALACFLFVNWCAVRASWRESAPWGPAKGVSLGLGVYLLTCLAGHPLLVSGAAFPFWIALGIAASPGATMPSSRRLRWIGTAAVLLVAATLPFRASTAIKNADVEHASVGFSSWHQQPDGTRYRWAGGQATFHVSPAVRSIRIPLRRGPMAPPVVEVVVFLDGIEANRVVLREGDDERTVRLNLFRRATTPFARIDLVSRVPGGTPLRIQATESGGVLLVERPIPEG